MTDPFLPKIGDKVRIIEGIGKGKLGLVVGVQREGLCTPKEWIAKVKIINPDGRVKYRYLWYCDLILNPSKRKGVK